MTISIKLIKFFLVTVLIILNNLVANGQTKPVQKVAILTLDFAYLEGCETGKGDCRPLEIFRQNKQDSVLIIFPSGGSESDVYLYSSIDTTIKLHDKKSMLQGKPTLNISRFDDGEYTARIISCNLGASCVIRLRTKE